MHESPPKHSTKRPSDRPWQPWVTTAIAWAVVTPVVTRSSNPSHARAVIVIVLGAYLFSLLTTILPALQAARIYPADALRYE